MKARGIAIFCRDNKIEMERPKAEITFHELRHIHKSKGGRNKDIQTKSLSIKQSSKALEVYKYYVKDLELGQNIFKNKAESYEKAFAG